jgi:hypothetical protein
MQPTAKLLRKYLEEVTNVNYINQLYFERRKYDFFKLLLFSIVYNKKHFFIVTLRTGFHSAMCS